MKTEVSVASWFLAQASKIEEVDMVRLQKEISDRMIEKYQDHWYPQQPDRGSAFRSISISGRFTDAIVLESAQAVGITDFPSLIKNPLTLYVNPFHVSVQYCNSVPSVLYSQTPKELEDSFPSMKKNPTKKLLVRLVDAPVFTVQNSEQAAIYLTPSSPSFFPNKPVHNF